jgi:hypothetical protein
MKVNVFALFGILIFSFIVGVLIQGYALKSFSFSGLAIANVDENIERSRNYSWTKAICDNENKCIDVMIECRDGSVVSIEPVSELIDNGLDWVDPRNEDVYCE